MKTKKQRRTIGRHVPRAARKRLPGLSKGKLTYLSINDALKISYERYPLRVVYRECFTLPSESNFERELRRAAPNSTLAYVDVFGGSFYVGDEPMECRVVTFLEKGEGLDERLPRLRNGRLAHINLDQALQLCTKGKSLEATAQLPIHMPEAGCVKRWVSTKDYPEVVAALSFLGECYRSGSDCAGEQLVGAEWRRAGKVYYLALNQEG